jgi:ABC-2 type transport system ATP-binding protein
MPVEVQHLTKLYGEQRAVDDITFSVSTGDVLGFLGPNGAGKSTTMKMLTCFLPPDSGEASVCGYDIRTQSLEVRRHIGYLPESNPLYYDMYVKEYLHFVADIYGLKKNAAPRIKALVDMTGLGEEQHKKIGALSKGYKQRVGLAQALMHDPPVLILDEPTTGLDPNQIREIRQLIKELGKEKAIIFSTHIMQEVQAICDRVIIINKGKLVADDTTANLSKKFGRVSVLAEFARPILHCQFTILEDISVIEPVSDTVIRLSGEDGLRMRQAVAEWSAQQGIPLLLLQEEASSMENIFRSLTQTDNPA